MNVRAWFAFVGLVFAAEGARGDDWYRWRGPDVNGISRETGWFKPWPKEGPRQIWKAGVGAGYSTVSVGHGRVFTCGSENHQETVFCLDEKTGRELWRHTYTTRFVPQYYEGGSSGTPTIDGNRVYHLGQMGELFCFEDGTGQVVWSNNVATAGGTRIPTWGLTGAPLVQGNLLILNAGTGGTAVDKRTGKVMWHSSGEGGYATPVPFKFGILIFGTKALVAVDGKSGKQRWEFPWRTTYDMNAADPVIVSDSRVLISSDYNHGSALLEMTEKKAKALWQNQNMKNPFASSVILNGFAYGIDAYAGKPNGTLRCIEVAGGALKWTEATIGNGALMAAENKLIIMSEHGELVIAEASAERFQPIARAQILGGRCWTVPVLANGRIIARNAKGEVTSVAAGE